MTRNPDLAQLSRFSNAFRFPAKARLHEFSRVAARLVLLLIAGLAIGAFAAPARAVEIQVEVLTDSLAQPPAPGANVCTLRKAINNANDNLATYPQCQAGDPGNDTIVFNVPGTITFSLAGSGEDGGETGDLDITDSITIIGNPGGTTIDAADLDRIFDINPSGAAGIVVILRNIHITNGTGPGGAGAIQLRGATLILENCTISNSVATVNDAGAIYMWDNATMNMTNTTVTGNFAAIHAGAILVESGVANITNSTITGNNTGPGFQNLTGGIRNTGIVNLRNTIVAGNNPGGSLPNLDGTFNSLGYNIIGDLGDNLPLNPTIVPAPGTADQINVNDALVNLGPLQNNGGPTPTRALQAGSIAKDKGHSSGSTSDQRGLTRPCDDGSIPNALGGDGGDVGAFEVQVMCVVGSPPNAVDDVAVVAEDSGANIINVRANDTDADMDTLTVTSVTQGANGSVAITNAGANVSYTPNANFFGGDSFTYTIGDGNGGFDTATVAVTVTPVPDAPVANDDNAALFEDSGANVINVLANDFDADGDTLVVFSVTQGTNGTVANNGTSVSYTPNSNFFGNDSFTYTISDGNGGFDTATGNVAVANINDAPVANNDNYNMNQDTTLNVPAPGVLTNDTDADGDTLTAVYVVGNGPNHGMLTLNPNGSFSYTPNANFTGVDTFNYVAKDGSVDSNVATVTITINDTQAPTVNSSVATAMLWPPNHDLVNVGLSVTASDNDGMVPTIAVAVFSDEDDHIPAGGGMSPDAKDIAPSTLRLRAEREGDLDGRVYIIRIIATDTANNQSVSYGTVVVPKSQSKNHINSINAEAAAAVAAFVANGNNPPAGFYVIGDGPVVGPKQ
jgi:VCBS repeat-containing protein